MGSEGSVVVGYLDGGTWSASFGLSYRDLLIADLLGEGRIVREGGKELRQMCGTGGIVSGRNKVSANFLDNTSGEWLWFIDTDMSFGPDTVNQLVASADKYKRPVMGGLAFKQKRLNGGDHHAVKYRTEPTLFEYIEYGGEVGFNPIMNYPRGQVVPVAATGAACMLIHRRVLDRVRKEHGDVWFDPITHPTGDQGKPRTFSEDLSFCVRLQALDIPVHVDTSVKTAHHKGGLFLDEDEFDRQQAARQKPAQEARHV